MIYEIIQRLLNSNTIINPKELNNIYLYWELVYKNELNLIPKENTDTYIDIYSIHYHLYLFIYSLSYTNNESNGKIYNPMLNYIVRNKKVQEILNNQFINKK